MKTALIAVDCQFDFIEGALKAPTGDVAICPLLRRSRQVDLVVASIDWHPPDHFSFSSEPTYEDGSWPVHCVQNTPGAVLSPYIDAVRDMAVVKGFEADKEAYSAFEGVTEVPWFQLCPVTLLEVLEHHKIDKVIVGGYVLEYCVGATVRDAQRYGFETELAEEATVALNLPVKV